MRAAMTLCHPHPHPPHGPAAIRGKHVSDVAGPEHEDQRWTEAHDEHARCIGAERAGVARERREAGR
jgi:hypothetical protein